MRTVKDLLNNKGRDVWSIDSESSVFQAISMMAQKGIGALMVVDEGRLVGVVSERDYARKVILQGRASQETTVSEIMTRRVVYVDPSTTVESCLGLMTEKRIRHLPVLQNEELIGVLSIGDLVKSVIEEQQFVIEQLERYISS